MENQNHVHSFEDVVVAATCKEQGYTLHRCACGYEYKDRFVPTGTHTFQITEQTEPTCTGEGTQLLRCAVCDATATRPIPPKGHTWGKWNLLTVPGCTEKGKRNRVCTCCGYEEVYPIQPTGHKLTSPRNGKRGVTEYFCENCGQTVRKKSVVRRIIKWAVALQIVATLAVAVAIAWPFVRPAYHYHMGKYQMSQKDYTKAYYHLQDCVNYKDTQELLKNFVLLWGTESRYNASGKLTDTTEKTYDAATNQITHIAYNAKGKIQFKTETRYDQNGKMILHADYGVNGTLDCKNEYEYDEAGNTVRIIRYDAKGIIEKVRYEYDENGNLLRTTEQNGKGKVTRIIKNEYDSHSNQIKSTVYDSKGNVTSESTWKYKYDKQGNVTRQTQYDANGNMQLRYDMEYDGENNKIREIRYGPKGHRESEYNYDDRGNVISFITCKENGDQETKVVNIYDWKKENLTESIYYDAYDNVTGSRQIIYKNGQRRSDVTYDVYGDEVRRSEYDKYGSFLGETMYDKYGEVEYQSRYEYEYDRHGNPISITCYDTDGDLLEQKITEGYQVAYIAG